VTTTKITYAAVYDTFDSAENEQKHDFAPRLIVAMCEDLGCKNDENLLFRSFFNKKVKPKKPAGEATLAVYKELVGKPAP